jgi:glycosyltransferase involved in cell wall biosynthesis
MMVCFNASRTLPWAFGSLLAQTLNDWECVFVDDGSTDGSFDIVMSLGDPRVRAFRFDTNRGRGAARQFALEQAEGDYLCMLDADDWMYPWRLQTELDFLEAEPTAAIVSAGVAVLDGAGRLAGVRGKVNRDKPQLFPPMTRLRMPPLAFAPCMIRMNIGKRCKFDQQFSIAEDADFLMQIILNHKYLILNRNLYVYNEDFTVSLERLLMDSRTVGQMFHKHRARFPLQSRIWSLTMLVKSLGYRGAFAIDCSEWLVRRRSRDPTLSDKAELQEARATVASRVVDTFGIS